MLYNQKVTRNKRPKLPTYWPLRKETEDFVINWLGEEDEELVDLIMELDISDIKDGYTMAKALNDYVDVYREDIDKLDWYEYFHHNKAIEQTQKAWCTAYGIKTFFEEGEIVIIEDNNDDRLSEFISDNRIEIVSVKNDIKGYFIRNTIKPNSSRLFYAEDIHDMEIIYEL